MLLVYIDDATSRILRLHFTETESTDSYFVATHSYLQQHGKPKAFYADRAAIFRGYPQAVRTDNGPEFTSRAFMAWAHSHGVQHILIEPGRPMQNGYIESFNGRLRDEFLNTHEFVTMQDVRERLKAWKDDYNTERPHG